MQIENNKVTTLHYTLKDNEGTIIDQSEDGSFIYLHGSMNIIPGLETALTGKSAGEELSVKVSAEEGYGPRFDDRMQEVSKSMFEEGADIQIGMQFHAEGPEGDTLIVTVTEIKDELIVVDGNHPLAGMELNFDVKIIEVRDASEEEIEHGHVHGEHGHHH